ncbi:MAG: acetoacetate--CoA ligase [Candidatus Lambdaproteobacteria bacterium]|nr:acetoacetate--CoA ligase [Candidatus Lambdaproteobacteria bacterium]
MATPPLDMPLWSPSPERVHGTNLWRWMEALRARHGFAGGETPTAAFAAFHRWSVESLETFWEEAWRDAAVRVSAPHRAVLTERRMPLVRFPPHEGWFPGARFNFAEHYLRFRDDRPALLAEDEAGNRRTLTHRQLYAEVCRAARGLRALGVGPGDRVAGFVPNTVEAVVGVLATAALGAVWSSTSPDFGFKGVMDRFGQINPKVLLCTDGYRYGGTMHHTLEKAAQLAREIPSIRHTVLIPFLGIGDAKAGEVAAHARQLPGGMTWAELLWRGDPGDGFEFPHFPFDHPLYVLYSSGTTGVPKCIVHGAGGTLLKHHVEHKFLGDLRREDRLFYFTTCGWMMFNWLLSGLAQGAAIVLYDGNPAWPEVGRLFQLAEGTGITVFGTSPKYLGACQKAGLLPGQRYDLSRLRSVLSTGSPLERSQFHWVYEALAKPGARADLQLASISGGTDVIGCFMGGNPLLPVYPGEIQSLSLGVATAAFDEGGHAVFGAKGELVCDKPFPSMPLGLWGDPEGVKFREAYFEMYPGIWRHGDYIQITPRGGVVVYGRSDATLNPGGVRIGTAEIYRIVEALPEIADSLVVGIERDNDVRVILFVVPAPGQALDAALEQKIRHAIRAEATPRHVPAAIRAIREVPVTLNGKKVELAVANVLRGEEVKNRDALANPDSLKQFEGVEV